MTVCTATGCVKPEQARGLCNTHYSREWRRANPDRALEMSRRWDNKNLEKRRESSRTWKQKNPRKRLAQKARRRAAKLNATPPWADLAKIKAVYLNCPEGFEVDHVEPLQGENICGLHVHYNLQYLTPEQNKRKGNRS